MPSAIADASVLIHLSKLGRLGLLRDLYDTVVVPAAVWEEVVEEGGGRPGAKEVATARDAGWMEVDSPGNDEVLRLLRQSLGPGESEAIALAIEEPDGVLLVDEKDARRRARVYELRKTGTIGVLVQARVEGAIENLEPILRDFQERAGFWISDDLIDAAIERVDRRTGED